MSDSLVLANTFELLGGGVASTLPQCTGAKFRLGTQYNFGTPQPVIDFTAAMMGDGERPSGWRYSNRTFSLPVVILVPTTGSSVAAIFNDRLTLAGAREMIQQAISADQFTLVWSPEGALGQRDTIYECWRAAATGIEYDYGHEKNLICQMTITFDAMPFGRSDVEQTLNFDSPVIGATAPAAQVEVDNFTAINTSTQVPWWSASGQSAYGFQSAWWNHSITDFNSPALYTRTIFDAGQTATFEAGLGNYTQTGNCAVAQSAVQAHGGTKSMTLTSSAGGDMSAGSCLAANFATQMLACVPGDIIHVAAFSRSVASARSVAVGAEFYTAAGVQISATFGTTVTNSTSNFTTNPTADITAPATAAWVRNRVEVLATGAGAEVHYFDDITMTRGAAVDLTGRSKLTMWFGLGADGSAAWRRWHKGPVNFTFTLTDASARTITFGTRIDCTASDNPLLPRWNLVSCHIPQGKTFTYTNVVGYSIKAVSETHNWTGPTQALSPAAYLSGLLASPEVSPKRAASQRGGTYLVYDAVGTAPSPVNLHCQMSPAPLVASTVTYVLPGTPGNTQQFVAPAENPNTLSGDASNFDKGSVGTWVGGADGLVANGTVTFSAAQSRSAPNSMSVVPISGGTNVTVGSCLAANVLAQGVQCAAGDRVSLRVYARAGTTVRNITVGAQFFTGAGASISRVDLSVVADTNSGFTVYQGLVTAPATSAVCRMLLTIATPAAAEVHYFDDIYFAYGVQATVICQAGAGAGGSTRPTMAAGGGGGGAEIAWELNLDLNPGANHAYKIGAGGDFFEGVGTGGNGTSSFFTGKSVTVTANGGQGGQNIWNSDYLNGTGGLGGTGSGNAHHSNGGAGAQGNYAANDAGGGGGSAGDGGAGGAGSAPAGGLAGASGSLGIKGAGGGSGMIIGTNNVPGGYPGGGGGGAISGTTYNRDGANGNDGRITVIIKSYTAPGAFPALILHKPSPKNTILAQPVIDVGAGLDTPDGTHEYFPSSVTPGQAARFVGTYTMLLANFSWHGAGARTVSVTAKQYEASGGAVSSTILSQSVTPSGVSNSLVNMGNITLPIKDMAPDNTDSYFTFSPTSGDTLDRFMDILLLDTQGQLVWISLPGAGYTDYWIDSPELTADVGRVLGSVQQRAQAVSVLGQTFMTGGPMRLSPGDNLIMVYSPGGMPALEAQYFPNWWSERIA
jgi:hypothetical protein